MGAPDPFGLIGQIIDGQLRVDEVVGEGGFSIVYKGEHVGLGEPVAIKCLKLPRKLDPVLADAFGKRFRDEGRLLYRLSRGSLSIVRSITSGTTVAPASGMLVPYMALEWLDGHSLVQEFRVRRERGKMPMSLDEAFKVFDPAVRALAYAHEQGVVHRDVKPGNLFYTRTREGWKLKVLDFGLAKIFDDEALGMQASVKTSGNFFMCSPSYGAPEQFDARLGPVGPWTDVYAIALVVVEALADKKARHADSVTEAAMIALHPATKPTPRSVGVTVPDAVEELLARAVSMRAADRPRTCGELWDAMRDALRASMPAARAVPVALASEPISLAGDDLPPHTVPLPRASATPPVAPLAPTKSTLRMDAAPPRAPSTPPVTPAPAPRAPFPSAPPPFAPGAPFPSAPPPFAPPELAPHAFAPPGIAPPTSAPLPRAVPTGSSIAPPRRSSAALVALVVLVAVAVLGAATWGAYVIMQRRAMPPRVGAWEGRCPSSPT